MPGTKAGSQKAKATILKKYGEDYFAVIGKEGGKLGRTGGFHYAKKHYKDDDPRHPANAGRIGGTISRRTA